VNEKYIAFAVPFMFVMIGLEILINRAQGDVRYRLADTVSNIGVGIGQQALGPFFKTVGFWAYAVAWERYRVATVPVSSTTGWIVLLIFGDFAYFLFHWVNHRVNFLWAGHVVHHQSEEYNFSTAVRQSWLMDLVQGPLLVPLALIGFPPEMLFGTLTINALYQFCIHTRAVGRLGPLEWILNTPSHHRVHHGINPKYIDRNFGGMFIIWDRLFGTFTEEEEEPVYGTVTPLRSFDPVWANVHYFTHLGRMSRRTKSWRDRVKLWFMPPEWRPADLGGTIAIPEVSRATQRKYQARTPRWITVCVLTQLLFVSVVMVELLVGVGSISSVNIAIAALLIVMTLESWGAWFDMRRWAYGYEAALAAAITSALLLFVR
jgi:sterol desaturase/sphingolipid hydroxylase (fatty acid hydroxylase superfamily)